MKLNDIDDRKADRAAKENPANLKELKVRIPVSQHIKLHAIKITRGRAIGDIIREALDDYFVKTREGS